MSKIAIREKKNRQNRMERDEMGQEMVLMRQVWA
jgi:hypothetical protein